MGTAYEMLTVYAWSYLLQGVMLKTEQAEYPFQKTYGLLHMPYLIKMIYKLTLIQDLLHVPGYYKIIPMRSLHTRHNLILQYKENLITIIIILNESKQTLCNIFVLPQHE